jgi:hypothetical protein
MAELFASQLAMTSLLSRSRPQLHHILISSCTPRGSRLVDLPEDTIRSDDYPQINGL